MHEVHRVDLGKKLTRHGAILEEVLLLHTTQNHTYSNERSFGCILWFWSNVSHLSVAHSIINVNKWQKFLYTMAFIRYHRSCHHHMTDSSSVCGCSIAHHSWRYMQTFTVCLYACLYGSMIYGRLAVKRCSLMLSSETTRRQESLSVDELVRVNYKFLTACRHQLQT